jgi:hypothetical protein
VCPPFVLLAVHPELTASNLAYFDINASQLELTYRKTHGGAAITAAPRLMKHQGTVFALELLNELAGRIGDTDTARIELNHIAVRVRGHQKKPNAFSP